MREVKPEEIPSLSPAGRSTETRLAAAGIYQTSAAVMRKEEEKTFADIKMRAIFISPPPYR